MTTADVRYARLASPTAAWAGIVREVASRESVTKVLDVGGGANPILPAVSEGVRCKLVDLDADELEKAPSNYEKQVADFASSVDLGELFDLVISKFVCEHIRDPVTFHRNVFNHLRPGGRAVHLFPTLYAPPFVLNRVLGEGASVRMLSRVQEGRERKGRHAKFPAYYRWCRGPSSRQLARFHSLGYEVETYVGCFGFAGYLSRWPLLVRLESRLSTALLRHPNACFTSYAYLVLRRPALEPHERV